MKKILTLAIIFWVGIVRAEFAPDSFCGFQFGSEYVAGNNDQDLNDRIRREGILSRPFRHFSKYTLFYGKGNNKLYQVNIHFRIPNSWTYEMYCAELRTVRELLIEKFGIRLVLSKLAFTDRFNCNHYCSNNDYFGANRDITYVGVGVSNANPNVQGMEFTIAVCRNDILKENSEYLNQMRRDKTRQGIERGMKGGGIEVL